MLAFRALRLTAARSHLPAAGMAGSRGFHASSLVQASFDKKKDAEQAAYFNKQDEQALRNLLKKMKATADKEEPAVAAGEKVTEMHKLQEVLGSHKLPEDVLDKLIAWKHDQE